MNNMKVFYGERGTGKTKELIKAAAETPNSRIVCEEPRRMEKKIIGYGYSHIGIKLQSYDEYIKEFMYIPSIPFSNVFIDEGEKFLKTYFGIEGITFCREDK